jgi:spore coat protein A
VEPLPVFGPAGFGGEGATIVNRVDALRHPFLTVKMKQTTRHVLPNPTPENPYKNYFFTSNTCPNVNIQDARVWAYETSDSFTKTVLGQAFWPAVTLETRRFIPTMVTYVNELPSYTDNTDSVQGLITVDQTLHWADPLNSPMSNPCKDNPSATYEIDGTAYKCSDPYTGPVPAVVHLHGAEVSSKYDGGPDAWFTPDGKYGPAYNTLGSPGPGKAVYIYPNWQEPGTPWFHDHALGATRTNVYSGLAGFYFIRAPLTEPKNLPSGKYEIEMAIQDRQFDTNGQLYFADGSGNADSNLNGTPPNPDIHPFWIPENIGGVVVVNGSPWPYLNVEPRRYRFRIVGGSNARFWNLKFGSAPVYVIGADDNYLDKPTEPVDTVFLAPGERADIIVDFKNLAGQTFAVTNDARVPYPGGLSPLSDQPQMHNVMQIRVTLPLQGKKDTSCDPAAGQCGLPNIAKTVRLTDGNGNLAPGVTIDKKRQLILKEVVGPDDGPLEVLVNNTKWNGLDSPGIDPTQFPGGVTELPQVGSTELWEIINLTVDAHPMHTHLVQFQILNRQKFDTNADTGYPAAWAAAFSGKCTAGSDNTNPCPGYGPPNPYNVPNIPDGAIGGNPAIGPYLLPDTVTLQDPWESGWKDTAKAEPGEVLRIVVRWAPTYAPVSGFLRARPGKNLYPFDPTDGPGYVWHCHIVDHEDNEMMRPYKVKKVAQ